MTPSAAPADWAGFAAAPTTSGEVVMGTAFPALDDAETHLIVGAGGVSLISGHERLTVRLQACAIVRAWPDGARLLIGHDGIGLRVEPSLFRDGRQAVALLDSHVPPALRVEQPARDQNHIPVPDPPPAPPPRARRGAAARVVVRNVLLVLLFLGLAIRVGAFVQDHFGSNGATFFIVVISGLSAQAYRNYAARRRTRVAPVR